MVLRDWSRRKDIDAFATALAQDLARRFPPKSDERQDKGAKSQLASITDRLHAQAAKYRQEERLGVYGKARLGNTFRWRLKEIGYGERFISEVTHGLVLQLSKLGGGRSAKPWRLPKGARLASPRASGAKRHP